MFIKSDYFISLQIKFCLKKHILLRIKEKCEKMTSSADSNADNQKINLKIDSYLKGMGRDSDGWIALTYFFEKIKIILIIKSGCFLLFFNIFFLLKTYPLFSNPIIICIYLIESSHFISFKRKI